MSTGTLRVLSYNVKGLGLVEKRKIVLRNIEKLKNSIDIVFLQETHVDKEILGEIETQWQIKGQHFWSANETKKGTATLILNTEIKLCKVQELNDRCIRLSVDFQGRKFHLINSYFPSEKGERKAYIQNFSLGVEESIIWGGDFNFVETESDTSGNFKEAHGRLFQEVLEKNGSEVADATRYLGDIPERTFLHVGNGYEARLDRFYISKNLSVFLQKVERNSGWYRLVGEEVKAVSDHWPVFMSLKFKELPQGKGFWKLNTSLLDLEAARFQIQEAVDDALHLEPIEALQSVQTRALKIFKKLGKERSALEKSLLKEIDLDLKELKERRAPLSEIEALEMKRGIITLPQEQFKMRMLKISLDTFDEIPSKFLTNRLKAKAADVTIESLKGEKGEEICEMDQILEESAKFYESLYNLGDSSKRKRKRFLRKLRRKVKMKDIRTLERAVTAQEVESIIKMSKNDSSPGEDGLPYEFYKKFSGILAPLLAEVFDEIIRNPEKLPSEWKNGVIKLLYKKGDRKLLSNWRPITLLNTIYKLFTGLINKRLAVLLPKIIHPNQKGFVRGRYILDQVLTVKTIRELNSEGYVALLDFEKAFDRVNHNLILETLSKLGFSELFISLIEKLLGGTSRVLIRGYFSRPFSLTNGVRQGDTISPALFILVIETLAVNIRKDPLCRGVKVSSSKFIRILLFADDVCLIASDEASLVTMMGHVEAYSEANTGKINRSKCCLISLRPWEPLLELFGISFISAFQAERYLGYEFHLEKKRNGIEQAIKKFETHLVKWKNLHLSILGRASVMRTYAMPLLFYVTSVDLLTREEERKVNNLMYWFLFSYESTFSSQRKYNSRLSIARLTAKPEKGGLGLVPISIYSLAQKVNWALRVFQRKSGDGWVHSFNELIEVSKGEGWDIPVEMSMAPSGPVSAENLRLTLKAILLAWFSISKKFTVENSPFLGSWGKYNCVTSIFKVTSISGSEATLLETENDGGSISLKRTLTTRPTAHLVQVRVKDSKGTLEFVGPGRKHKMFKQGMLGNGIQILKAEFNSVLHLLCSSEEVNTPKQKEWESKFSGWERNFSLLTQSKVRNRVKSHVFMRFSNLLPREREGLCPRCREFRESSDHVLFECRPFLEDAAKVTTTLAALFGITLTPITFLTVLQEDLRVRVLQMSFLHCAWSLRCKIHHGEPVRPDFIEKFLPSEIKRFLSRLLFLEQSEPSLNLWSPLIESLDLTKKEVSLVPLFQHHEEN